MQTFAVQVRTGSEVQVKYRIEDMLRRQTAAGNDYAIVVHAMETFTQRFNGKDEAPKQITPKVPGYIFVTIKDGLDQQMKPEIWHLIKNIPSVLRILNHAISEAEWISFADVVCEIAPVIEINSSNNSRLKEIVRQMLTFLHKRNEEKAKQLVHLLEAIVIKTKATMTTYTIPFSLFKKTRERIDPDRRMEISRLTDQRFILPEIGKTLMSLAM